MKYLKLALLIPFVFANLYSGDETKLSEKKQASDAHKRWMESAHPTPVHQQKKGFFIPMAPGPRLPKFLNVNTIEEDEGSSPIQNESSIAVNPVNPLNLISSAVDYRGNSEAHVYVSSDGGRSWVNLGLGRPHPNWRSSNDPSVVFDSDGTGYLVYGAFPVGSDFVRGNGIYLARTSDQGATWEPHIVVIEHTAEMTPDSSFEDKYYISVDNSQFSPYKNHLYIPWKRMTPRDSATQIMLSKSTDKGSTWSSPVAVSNRLPGSTEDTTFGQSFPIVATGPEGDVYAVWNHGIEHGVGYAKSTDGGATFSVPRIIHNYEIFGETRDISGDGEPPNFKHTVKGKVRAEAYPVISCDISGGQRNGYVYVCWAAGNPPDIFFSRSADGGDSWSEPIIVSADPTNDQFWPWMATDQTNGDLGIMYFDSRNDAENLLVECWVSYSSDGGETWTDRQAADFASDLRLNPFRGNSFAGDYSGMAFYDGIIYPSWVDMRYAVDNISDSDVYTAIVDTKAPSPVENFTSVVFPEFPQRVRLGWDVVLESTFGRQLNTGDISLLLFRNGQRIDVLSGDISEYTDDGLAAFEKYVYEIYAAGNNDTSIARTVTAYPGGARRPAPPEILGLSGNAVNTMDVRMQLPNLRADNVTPLVSLKSVSIFVDDVFFESFEVSQSDTGKVKSFVIQLPERGYYKVHATVTDEFEGTEIPPQESEISNDSIEYTGVIESAFDEEFDILPLPNYLFAGYFQATGEFFHSPPNSLTESPDGNYKNRQKDIMQIFPVASPTGRLSLSFWHAAIVAGKDSAIVEISGDYGLTWEKTAFYDKDSYQPWANGQLDNEDWKREQIQISTNPGDTVMVRFRFASNAFRSDDGWYIDDIKISEGQTSVESDISGNMYIFPNPASEFITIQLHSESDWFVRSIRISSILGENVLEMNGAALGNESALGNEITIGLGNANLPTGVYMVIVGWDSGRTAIRKLIISK